MRVPSTRRNGFGPVGWETSAWLKPVPGPITGWFHEPRTKDGKKRRHHGVDLRAAVGTPVVASYEGTVIRADLHKSYGYMVLVDHGRQTVDDLYGYGETRHVYTLYAHLDHIDVNVKPGRHVTTGQAIGQSGQTGSVETGPHLHFELIASEEPINWALKPGEGLGLNPGVSRIDPAWLVGPLRVEEEALRTSFVKEKIRRAAERAAATGWRTHLDEEVFDGWDEWFPSGDDSSRTTPEFADPIGDEATIAHWLAAMNWNLGWGLRDGVQELLKAKDFFEVSIDRAAEADRLREASRNVQPSSFQTPAAGPWVSPQLPNYVPDQMSADEYDDMETRDA